VFWSHVPCWSAWKIWSLDYWTGSTLRSVSVRP